MYKWSLFHFIKYVIVSCQPLSALDQEIGDAAKRCCQAYLEYAEAEANLKRKIKPTSIPHWESHLAEHSSDRLEQVSSTLSVSYFACNGYCVNACLYFKPLLHSFMFLNCRNVFVL